MNRTIKLLLLLGVVTSGGCQPQETRPEDDGVYDVYTTFYPLTEFAIRIAGDRAKITCPLPEGEDPIFWKPTREIIENYRKADLVVINGAALEKWIDRAALPRRRVLDTAASFKDEHVKFESTITHAHGSGGEHSHEGVDGHTWVDPVLAKRQAEAIFKRLTEDLPEYESEFRRRFDEIAVDFDALAASFAAVEGLDSEWSYASHPAYNYLASRYGWKFHSLDLDPDTRLTEEQLAEIRDALETRPSTRILWESAPSSEVRAQLEPLGLRSIVFSPVEGTPPPGETYFTVMKSNLASLSGTL